jgi:hypothetical protein
MRRASWMELGMNILQNMKEKKLFIEFNSTLGLEVDLHVRQKWFGFAFLCDFRLEFWEEVTLL